MLNSYGACECCTAMHLISLKENIMKRSLHVLTAAYSLNKITSLPENDKFW